mgnify:CR=1 FL=1
MYKRQVLHYLEVLRDEIGWDAVKAAVVKPLTGRKIGAYYGCMLLRPSREMQFDDPENPKMLEDFIRAIGAEPVLYAQRNECCGGYMAVENRSYAAKQAQKIMVYDLGGGTFDVSILEIDDGVIEVLATAGNNRLGGDDFDKCIMDYLAAEFKKRNGSLICGELLGLKKKDPVSTIPEERTAQYYSKRPCAKMVEEAARIWSEYLEKHPK